MTDQQTEQKPDDSTASSSTPLLPCPCGETPTELHIRDGDTHRWRIISGNCCGEWEHECRVPTVGDNATPDGQKKACVDAWNTLPRAR